MQVTYNGEHSVLIGDFVDGKYDDSGFLNTWENLHLIPTSVPVIAPPPLKTNTVEVPGANGVVDMTDILVGRPLYDNRTGSIDFYIDNTCSEYTSNGIYRWDYAYDKLLNTLHGFRKKLILTDSRSYYYEGRVSVNAYKSDKLTGTITLDYDLDPFKYCVFTSTEPWLWNPFDFDHGIIPDDVEEGFKCAIAYEGMSKDFSISNDVAGVVPQIPIITAWPAGGDLRPVDWEKTMESQPYPGIEFTPYGSNSSMVIDFRKTDEVIETIGSTTRIVYRLTNPTASNGYLLTVGDPRPNYSFKWKYRNYFRDSQGEVIPTQFFFDFRPRRL